MKRYLHGNWDNDVECEAIYVSNDTWAALTLGSGSTPDQKVTVVSADLDTGAGIGPTITGTVKLGDFERVGPPNANGVVRCTLKAAYIAKPTIA